MINIILRLITLVLLIIWRVYWFLTTKKALINKPKISGTYIATEPILFVSTAIYVIVNLIGLVLFPFNNLSIQLLGFILLIFGFTQAIIARKTLADNWTESFEYQIKKNHELISNGIYRYVRHPIYGGLLLMVCGSLMVATTYTFFIGILIALFYINIFALREEKILTKHFGKKYSEYMKATKKFIPFIY